MIGRNFWRSEKNSVGGVQSHLKFRKFKVALNAIYWIFLKRYQKLRLIIIIKY